MKTIDDLDRYKINDERIGYEKTDRDKETLVGGGVIFYEDLRNALIERCKELYKKLICPECGKKVTGSCDGFMYCIGENCNQSLTSVEGDTDDDAILDEHMHFGNLKESDLK